LIKLDETEKTATSFLHEIKEKFDFSLENTAL